MSESNLRNQALADSSESFILLAKQVQYMLDVIEAYAHQIKLTSLSARFKMNELRPMILTLGEAPSLLASVILEWNSGLPRQLSQTIVEKEILLEIWCTLEVLLVFFIQEGWSLRNYNRLKAEHSFQNLQQSNRLFT